MSSHPFNFRPGTNDEAMFRHLTTHNEYRLPDRIGPEEIIVDVGVHIGSFCYAALGRGARRVFGFEAGPENFACAAVNLAAFGDRVRLENKAVWRSDRAGGTLRFTTSEDGANTGGGSVFWAGEGSDVGTIALDDLIGRVTEGGRRRISLLKIDCEGAEFPILLTATRLGLVDRIHGEFHELGCPAKPDPIPEHARVPGVPAFTVEALALALRRAGFEVDYERAGDSFMGLFFAARPRRRATRIAGRLKQIWHHLAPGRGPAPHGGGATATARETERTTS